MTPICTGYGTEEWANPKLHVEYFADGFPRGKDGTCVFCEGDPCNEYSPPDSRIAVFYSHAPQAETCPVCDGRPT